MVREDWGAAWRFCGVQSPWEMAHPEQVPSGFFSLAGDPLARATEYAVVCLFLRGDGDAAIVSADRTTGDFSVKGERTSGGFSESGLVRGGNVVARGDKGPVTHVYALATDGSRLREVRSTMSSCGRLSFGADVAAVPDAAAFLYEILLKTQFRDYLRRAKTFAKISLVLKTSKGC